MLRQQAFRALKAEQEREWFERVFLRPPDFEEMATMRSSIVFGASGMGKTILRLALLAHTCRADGTPSQLVIEWRPPRPGGEETRDTLARLYIQRVFEAAADALLRHIVRLPESYSPLPEWVRATIIWFLQHYLYGDPRVRLSRLADEFSSGSIELARALLTGEAQPILSEDASEYTILAELTNAVRRLGLDGIWIVCDKFEAELEESLDDIALALAALLDALPLFEDPHCALKIFAPIELEAVLGTAKSVDRMRIDVYRLEWSATQLKTMIEQRLSQALEMEHFRLTDLGEGNLESWLEKFSGQTPRGWLFMTGRFYHAYLAQGGVQPLSIEYVHDVQQKHPPELRLVGDHVMLGYQDRGALTPKTMSFLRYLYNKPGRQCSRAELYYKALREPQLKYIPGADNKDWEAPKDWGKIVDTNLWRLRKEIEPNAGEWTYLISEKNDMIRLKHAL